MPEGSPAVVRAEEAGAELDEGTLLVSRTVSAEGRSRAHLGGRSVPVGLLGSSPTTWWPCTGRATSRAC